MAQICKIQWRFPEAKPLSSQVISNRHKHTLENTRSCEKSISTEINSEHTRNLNGTLEITKKKKKTTTTLQGISIGKNVLARTSKAKETQGKLKAHEASKHKASAQQREQRKHNLHKQRKHLSAAH